MRTIRSFGCLVVVAQTAVAQPAPAEQPTSSSLFDEGRALLDAGQPGPACAKFEAALKLDPEALGSVLNLGLCNEQLDHIATALRWFRRVQARASELGKGETEAAAKAKTTALAAKVPTLEIQLAHAPLPGTVVRIDGAQVAEVDYARVEIDAGTHVVDVTFPKQPAFHAEVTVSDGDARVVAVPVELPVPPKHFIVVDHGATTRRNAYLLAGAGGALWLGEIVLGTIAKRRYDATDMLDTRDHWRDVMRYGGSLVFLAGGAAITGAVMLYLRAPKAERVEVAPAAGAGQLGLSVAGAF